MSYQARRASAWPSAPQGVSAALQAVWPAPRFRFGKAASPTLENDAARPAGEQDDGTTLMKSGSSLKVY